MTWLGQVARLLPLTTSFQDVRRESLLWIVCYRSPDRVASFTVVPVFDSPYE